MGEEKITLKSLQKHIVLTILGSLLTSAVVPISFYYTTKNTLSNHTVAISEIKDDVKNMKSNINTIMLIPVQNADEVRAIKEITQNIMDRQEKLEERVDKIYELLTKK